MIRLIVQTAEAAMAANVGGPVQVSYRTFLIELADLEAYLREPSKMNWTFTERRLVGAELVEQEDSPCLST
jgi:hypothetical protein